MISSAARIILGVHALAVGLGYALGPPLWYSGGTFSVIRSLGLPVPAWGAVIMFAGVLLLARRHTAGHAIALIAFLFWGLALAATAFTGQLTGLGSPAHTLLLVVPMHALGLWRRSESRVDARTDCK